MSSKNIGVIVDTMDGVYQSTISYSLMHAAENKEINLVFMSGMASSSKENLVSEHNAVFQLLNKKKIDGIIYIVSSLEIYVGHEGIMKIVEVFEDLPSVSISVEIPNTKSIVIDNYKSEYMVTEHMLKMHDYKRIAYISGPLMNNEAISRYNGFKKAVDDYQHQFNNYYFYEGKFLAESGTEAVDYFNQLDIEMPDAIIAANDEMAIGAILRLKELGYDVPADVAVVGFDNIETTKAFFPSITTLNQPSKTMGEMAIKAIDDLLEGKEVSDCTYLPGDLIIRESCGCFSVIDYNYERKPIQKMSLKSFDEEKSHLLEHEKEIKKLFVDFIKPDFEIEELIKNNIHELIIGLVNDISTGVLEGDFIKTYNQMVSFINIYTNIEIDWHLLMMEFRHYIFTYITNREIVSYIEDEFILVSIVNGSNLSRSEAMNQFMFKRMYIQSRTLIRDLNSSRNFMELKMTISAALSSNKISECYICMYDDIFETKANIPVELPKHVTLVFGMNNGEVIEDVYFDTEDMLPKEYMNSERKYNLVFLSLFINQQQYGYIAFSIDAIDMLIYETLRGLISNAIKNQNIYQKRREAEIKLERVVKELELSNKKLYELSIHDELTGLYNRRGFYSQIEKLKINNTNNVETHFVLFGDIDGLKVINDAFGHREGDYAIYTTATILKKYFSDEDIIARMSGDEFTAVSLQAITEEDIKAVIESIHQAFDEHNRISGKPFNLSMSIGYAGFSSQLDVTIDELIKLADNDLYLEKAKKKEGIIK